MSEIGNQLALSRLLLVIIAIAIAIGQIVPYWVGRELLEAPVIVVADLDEVRETTSTRSPSSSTRSVAADPDRRADPDQG